MKYKDGLLDNSRIRQLADCQLADWTTRGLDISWTGQLADWTTRVLDKSRTGQLADATGDFACLFFLFGGICETASCPVRELTSPRLVQSASWQSASCPVTQRCRTVGHVYLTEPKAVELTLKTTTCDFH